MWVDRDWSLIRGWSLGYPKKVADDIRMTRLHKLTPHVPYSDRSETFRILHSAWRSPAFNFHGNQEKSVIEGSDFVAARLRTAPLSGQIGGANRGQRTCGSGEREYPNRRGRNVVRRRRASPGKFTERGVEEIDPIIPLYAVYYQTDSRTRARKVT